MKSVQTLIFLGFISSLSLYLSACSNDTEGRSSAKTSSGDHIWKSQTDSLKSAKDVAKKMRQSLKQHQEDINESN